VVRRSALRVAEPVARPDRVPEDSRWLHVRLSEQTLVAYEGDRPAYLQPDNPRYPILPLSPDAVIIGVVKQILIDMD